MPAPGCSGTTRDLLRWAQRQPDSYESLALHGYLLIAERLRDAEEKAVVLDVLQVRGPPPPPGSPRSSPPRLLHTPAPPVQRHCKVTLRLDDIYAAGGRGVPAAPTEDGAAASSSGRPSKRARGHGSAAAVPEAASADDAAHFADWPKDTLVSRLAGRLEELASDLLEGDSEAGPAAAEPEHCVDAHVAPRAGGVRARARASGLTTISVTKSLQRLYTIVVQCLAHDEPVLLVGDTGCGKTTVVQVRASAGGGGAARCAELDILFPPSPPLQILALLLGQDLLAVNCHAGTETADFLGSLRPARNHAASRQRFRAEAAAFLSRYAVPDAGGAAGAHDTQGASDAALLQRVRDAYEALPAEAKSAGAEAERQLKAVEAASQASSALFEWVDGPLVSALRSGAFFLLDECSLAEDAVLERLNSVLEPSRSLTLAEKGSDCAADALIVSSKGFRFFATMNPGGDFGKRELSPALRNRFTEVWVPPVTDADDLLQIVRDKAVSVSLLPHRRPSAAGAAGPGLLGDLSRTVAAQTGGAAWGAALVDVFPRRLVEFVLWFDEHASSGRLSAPRPRDAPAGGSGPHAGAATAAAASLVPRARLLVVTLRDLHQWLAFMAELMRRRGDGGEAAGAVSDDAVAVPRGVTLWEAYCHAACLVLLDGLGLGTGLPLASCAAIREAAVAFLLSQTPPEDRERLARVFEARETPLPGRTASRLAGGDAMGGCDTYGIEPFLVPMGPEPARASASGPFSFLAPTTRANLRRILRSLQASSSIHAFSMC